MKKLFLLTFLAGFFSLSAMDPTVSNSNGGARQDRIDLPTDVVRVILNFLDMRNPMFNKLMRHFGLTPETADKLISKFVERTALYPYDDEQIKKALTYFKTAKPGAQLPAIMTQALLRYRDTHPFQTRMYQRNNNGRKVLLDKLLLSYGWHDFLLDIESSYPSLGFLWNTIYLQGLVRLDESVSSLSESKLKDLHNKMKVLGQELKTFRRQIPSLEDELFTQRVAKVKLIKSYLQMALQAIGLYIMHKKIVMFISGDLGFLINVQDLFYLVPCALLIVILDKVIAARTTSVNNSQLQERITEILGTCSRITNIIERHLRVLRNEQMPAQSDQECFIS